MWILRVLLPLAVFVVSCYGIPNSQNLADRAVIDDAQKDYMLPEINVVPEHYDLLIEPTIQEGKFVFSGETKIKIKASVNVPKVVLHAQNLNISCATLGGPTPPAPKPPTGNATTSGTQDSNKPSNVLTECDKKLPAGYTKIPTNMTEDTKKNFLIFEPKDPLAPKDYILIIFYDAAINDEKKGFYRSSYVNGEGKTKWLASTHFEPVGARRAFPCFDEPRLKATFSVSIKHSTNLVAVANMPVQGSPIPNKENTTATTVFQETPKMSTYLVAFAVSDYGTVSNDDKTHNVWVRKNALESGKYALKFGQDVIAKLNDFTGQKYHLPKLDQISIPNLAAGAMENWGLVTYRETALLYDEKVNTEQNLESVSTIIAHEFTHQWFGNLVSPKWWTYVWLNEGFATYFQYYITNIINPNWDLMNLFVVKVQQGTAFVHDANENSHPMDNVVYTQEQISSTFDRIAYEKAGSVIHMMSHFLSETHFKNGLRSYLKKYEFKDAQSGDLLDSFQEVVEKNPNDFPAGFNVKNVMKSWINEPGYPVVSVVRDYESGKVTLTQDRFYLIKPNTPANTKWTIPINYVTKKNPYFNSTAAQMWFKQEDSKLEFTNDNFKGDNWAIFNVKQSGYYRVNYDEKNWGLLTKFLNSDSYIDIPAVSRAQLIDDALNLARAGLLNYTVAFELTGYLARETDYIAWYSAFNGMSFLDKVLANSPHYHIFKAFNARLILKVLTTIKTDEDPKDPKDDHVKKIARAAVTKWACYYGLKTCTQHAVQKFSAWVKEPAKNPLSPNLRRNILCTGLRTASEGDWNKTLAAYESANSINEKDDIVAALGCSSNTVNLWRFLNLVLEKDSKIEEASIFSSVISGSTQGSSVALDFIIENYDKIKEKNGNEKTLKTYLSDIGKRITTKDQFTTYALFIAQRSIPIEVTEEATKNAVLNINFLEKYESSIHKWLLSKNYTMPNEKKSGNSAGILSFTPLFVLLPILITRFY